MEIYVYSYRSDSSREAIGRIRAFSLFDARRKISILKGLSIKQIDNLFEIVELTNYEKNVKPY